MMTNRESQSCLLTQLWDLVGTAKPLQCCHGALIKYLLVGLAIYGPYVGAGVGVSLLIPVTETDEELKLYFTVWISKSFGVH